MEITHELSPLAEAFILIGALGSAFAVYLLAKCEFEHDGNRMFYFNWFIGGLIGNVVLLFGFIAYMIFTRIDRFLRIKERESKKSPFDKAA